MGLSFSTEAKNAGAAVIGLTAYARNPLAELSDTTLVAGATYRWDHERIGGNVVHTVLLSALHAAVIDRFQNDPKLSDRFIETVARVTVD
ncbi:hypothetical protein [Dietzia kunjamensis]|uniref:hypothetical protein n=1 Tax=Dietzia kunjamensis TaxID=322509 RepID=UPI002097678A|nr:hypothetical protein [Dietzia kunjamensis]USX47867.1 hypothetical protein NHB83_17935 [Dietzia kunjamensis]